MNIFVSTPLLLATSLALVAPPHPRAQEPEPRPAPAQRTPPAQQPRSTPDQAQQDQARQDMAQKGAPLVVQTAKREIAENLIETLGSDAGGERQQLPELQEGQHWVLKLEAKEMLTVTTAAGEVPEVSLIARPTALMDLYQEEVDQAVQMGQAMATMGMQQAGVTGAEAAQIVQSLVAFPRQIATLHMEMRKEEKGAQKQADIAIDVVPEPDSALALTWKRLQPNPEGVPVVEGDQPLVFHVSLAPSVIASYADTLARFSATMSQVPAERRTDYLEMQKKVLNSLAGAMTFTIGEGGMRFLAATQNSDQLRQQLESERYQQVMKDAAEASATADVQFQPAAFEHDGVKVHKTTVDMQGGGMGMGGGGTMDSYMAVAGEWLVGAFMAKSQDPVKQLIDRAQSGDVQRKQLPAGTLLVADIRPEALQGLAPMGAAPGGAAAGEDDADDMPNRIHVALEKTSTGLRLKIHGEGASSGNGAGDDRDARGDARDDRTRGTDGAAGDDQRRERRR